MHARSTAASNKRQRVPRSERLWVPRTFNTRTKKRFVADRTQALIRHLGYEPTYCEMILIDRICKLEWALRRIDARMDMGEELSGHAMRARLAAETRLRLDLRELGLRPTTAAEPPDPAAPLRAHLAARHGAGRAA